MGWLSDAIGVAASPFGAGPLIGVRKAGELGQPAERSDGDITGERMRMMQQGMGQGRQLGERIYGQGQEQTGADVQDVIQRRRDRLDKPSKAADAMRSQGQQERRYAKSKGASDLQQKNTSYQASRAAGLQEDMDYQKRLADFQSLVGNIASTQSSLELGGGQLGLASQYIAPPKQDQGLIGGLIGGLGL